MITENRFSAIIIVINLKNIKIMKMKYLIILLAIFMATNCLSQSISRQVIGSAGADMSNSDATLSWTIGEPVIESFSADDYILFQGFHIGPLSAQISDNLSENFTSFDVTFYPNPVNDQLVIEFDELREKNSILQLFSITGKMIISKKLSARSRRETINLSSFNSGTYFFKIIHDKKEEVYTIIKK
jgi:hypothetical protein